MPSVWPIQGIDRSFIPDIARRCSEHIITEVSVEKESETVRRAKTVAEDRQRGRHPVCADDDVIIRLEDEIRLGTLTNGPQIESDRSFLVFPDHARQIDPFGYGQNSKSAGGRHQFVPMMT